MLEKLRANALLPRFGTDAHVLHMGERATIEDELVLLQNRDRPKKSGALLVDPDMMNIGKPTHVLTKLLFGELRLAKLLDERILLCVILGSDSTNDHIHDTRLTRVNALSAVFGRYGFGRLSG